VCAAQTPVSPGTLRLDDVTSDAIGSLALVCSMPGQDYLTRQLLLSLSVSECAHSEAFLRAVVFGPETSLPLK
jgi:hypothetical protein